MRVAWLKDLRLKDLPQVGGKNASLGEMIGGLSSAGIRVPGGFATTADAFREFLAQDGRDKKIESRTVVLGPLVDGLRVVRKGLSAGELIVVSGLQRVRPGVPVNAAVVAMGGAR